MRNTHTREPGGHGGSPAQASTLEALCSTGSTLLAEHVRYHAPAAPGAPDRWWIARSLWIDFGAVLSDAEAICRSPAPAGDVDSCLQTLENMRRVRLDLTADAVLPTGEVRFVRDLERLEALWTRWQEQARAALAAPTRN